MYYVLFFVSASDKKKKKDPVIDGAVFKHTSISVSLKTWKCLLIVEMQFDAPERVFTE